VKGVKFIINSQKMQSNNNGGAQKQPRAHVRFPG